MCLFVSKDSTNRFLAATYIKPDDWIVVYKRFVICDGQIFTPYQNFLVTDPVMKPLSHHFDHIPKRLVRSYKPLSYGIHAYQQRPRRLDMMNWDYNDICVKCYVRKKDIFGVGCSDVVARELTIDPKHWKKMQKIAASCK